MCNPHQISLNNQSHRCFPTSLFFFRFERHLNRQSSTQSVREYRFDIKYCWFNLQIDSSFNSMFYFRIQLMQTSLTWVLPTNQRQQMVLTMQLANQQSPHYPVRWQDWVSANIQYFAHILFSIFTVTNASFCCMICYRHKRRWPKTK